MEVRAAFWEDIMTVGRLIAQCFGNHGLSGCICQFAVRARSSSLTVLCACN